MRIFRGLENIHSVIDRHEAEWRKEQGENPKLHDPLTIEETVRRRLTAQNDEGSGRFSADRFLGIKSKPAGKNSDTPVQTKPEPKPEPEAVEVIKNKDGRHSWLYNEVMKAINDAAKDNKNTKIIAVFVPVVQNGKEFEDLPADQIITTQPANEDDVKLEPELPEQKQEQEHEQEQEQQNENDFNLLPEGQSEPDAELAEAFMTMEEKLDEAIAESNSEPETEAPQEELNEPEQEAPIEPEAAQAEIIETEIDSPSEPDTIQEEITEPEPELEPEQPLIPQNDDEPEQEQEQAVQTEQIEPEPEPEPEQENEIIIPESHDENEFDSVPEIPEAADEAVDGEPLAFEEIDGESELAMPEMLDDDEVADDTFDESLTEVQRPDDDDDETIIIEDVDEPVEIIPDPEKKE